MAYAHHFYCFQCMRQVQENSSEQVFPGIQNLGVIQIARAEVGLSIWYDGVMESMIILIVNLIEFETTKAISKTWLWGKLSFSKVNQRLPKFSRARSVMRFKYQACTISLSFSRCFKDLSIPERSALQAWCCLAVNPVLGRQRQEEFKVTRLSFMKFCLKSNPTAKVGRTGTNYSNM